MPNWEFEKAKKDLVEFVEYAFSLYGPDAVLDSEDRARYDRLISAVGPESVDAMDKELREKHNLIVSAFSKPNEN